MKRTVFLVVACLLLGPQASRAGEWVFARGAVIHVLSVSGINLREKPSADSAVLALVPYGTKLTVLESTDRSLEIDNFSGYFVKVSYKGKTGYLFDGFCSTLPAPDLKKAMHLDNYAARYLGKGKEASDGVTFYPGDIVLEAISVEGYHGNKLLVPGIRLQEGFLVVRALAVSMDMGYTGKEAFPRKKASFKEKHGKETVETEVKIIAIDSSSTSYEITKTFSSGRLFVIAVQKVGEKVQLTIGSAD